ncbi:MAG: Type 1 glutamine amidotransferase-like domain-containing protein [Thermomicrobiales bacterium]
MAKQIVAIGGAGLSVEPDGLLLEQYILGLAGVASPKMCYIGTASGDSQMGIDRFYDAAGRLACTPMHLSLYKPSTNDLAGLLLDQEIIYVGGGSTRNLLALWREWGLDRIMRDAYDRGIILCGVSAGSICWFGQGTTDSLFGPLTPIACLGFLSGSNSPHYDTEPERRPTYHRLIATGAIEDGYAADDGVGLHFVDGALHKIISSRPNARAWRVERKPDGVTETEIVPVYLGKDGAV